MRQEDILQSPVFLGNHCNHNPLLPRLNITVPLKQGKGGHPPLIHYATQRLDKFYFTPRLELPELDLANGSFRQMRSERRESCTQVSKVLLRYYDMVTECIGIPAPNGMKYFSVARLSKIAGLSESRFWRATYDMKAAGFLRTQSRGFKKPVVRQLTQSFFAALGLSLRHKIDLSKAKRKHQIKEKHKYKQMDTKDFSFLGRIIKAIKKTTEIKNHIGPEIRNDRLARHRKEASTQIKMLEFRKNHPTWGHEKLRRMAEQKL